MNERRRFDAWRLMGTLKTFCANDIALVTGLQYRAAKGLLDHLVAAGYAEEVGREAPLGSARGAGMSYRLTRSDLPQFVDPARYWQRQAWHSMRILRRFTTAEVARTLTVEVSLRMLGAFADALVQVGALASVPSARPSGAAGSHKVWALVNDVGPTPPTEAEPARDRAAEVRHA